MSDDPDRLLVEKCQQVSGLEFNDAYKKLFVLYQDRVFNICYRVTGNEADALDAAQETMIAIARRISGFAFRSRFSSWVYRIAVNSAIDVKRKRLGGKAKNSRVLFGTEPSAEMVEQAVDPTSDAYPDAEVSKAENQKLIRQALADMNPKFSAILVLRYIEGLSYEDIAESQGCSLGTVKSRLNRAHQSLKNFLKARGCDSSLFL